MLAARDLYEFDNVFTAPLHGFRDTDDYWLRASSKPWLREVVLPTLVINARNDPFVPGTSLPGAQEVSAAVVLEQPDDGGRDRRALQHEAVLAPTIEVAPADPDLVGAPVDVRNDHEHQRGADDRERT